MQQSNLFKILKNVQNNQNHVSSLCESQVKIESVMHCTVVTISAV